MRTEQGLLKREDIEALEAFEEGSSGYFYRMLEYLERFIEAGIEEGRFKEQEAREDLEIALWYSYACNNLDRYEYYYKAVQWMRSSEKNAVGCGTWYYRFACALMYCGKLEEALRYAEQGVLEEPEYPWGWLQLGRLRSHFGDRTGALEAAERGLLLEPGDYEFLTLKKEIAEGRTLEEMEYHYIDPDCDQELQNGMDEDACDKQNAVLGIVCDREKLGRIKDLFRLKVWEADCPYCSGVYRIQDREVDLVFRMNEAALSKMDLDWLEEQKEQLDSNASLTYTDSDRVVRVLCAVLFDREKMCTLVYKNELEGNYIQIPLGMEEDSEENHSNEGSFVGFVLLSENDWDKECLLHELGENWNLFPKEPETEGNALVFHVEEMMAVISLVSAPVPDGEAEQNAVSNYIWPEAVQAAENHRAHLMVAVLGQETDLYERGKLFVKILSCCACQEYVSGIYTSGTVFEPQFYRNFAEMMKEDMLPVFNWIWFGLYRTDEGVCGYTYGMNAFGKDEMEVLDADAEPSEVRDFLADLASYVLEYDVTLKGGETIGFSEEQKLPITRSEGMALPGMTLKISYGRR